MVGSWRSNLSLLVLGFYHGCVPFTVWGAAGNSITCLKLSLCAFITSQRATPAKGDLIKPTVPRVLAH